MSEEDFVSVVVTGKNSSQTIHECLTSILNGEYPVERFEVIYIDAESTDGSLALVGKIASDHQNLKYFVERGLPGRGRNIGIRQSRGHIVAFTDADCIVHRLWLEKIASHLASHNGNVAGVGGPSITPSSDPNFAKYVGRLLETKFGAAGARNPARYRGMRFVDHNPTCNAAYKRWVFDKVGLFSENLPVTEDEEFDTRIRKQGYRLLYVDDVIVWHHRKSTLRSFAKQMYSYGFWRAHSGKRGVVPLKIQHFVPSSLILYCVTLPLVGSISWQLFAMPFITYLVFGLSSGIYAATKRKNALLAMTVPSLGFVEHITYGAGFLSGMLQNSRVSI